MSSVGDFIQFTFIPPNAQIENIFSFYNHTLVQKLEKLERENEANGIYDQRKGYLFQIMLTFFV